MLKLVLVFVYFGSVVSLDCYTTKLILDPKNRIYKLQSCRQYLEEISRQHTITVAYTSNDVSFLCFTIVVRTNEDDALIKGCIPANSCELFKNSLTLQVASEVVRQIACSECKTDACNVSNSTQMLYD